MTEENTVKTHYELQRTDDVSLVAAIAEKTIQEIYPRYYPEGAVEFFRNLHSEGNICGALEEDEIYLLLADGEAVGTGTIRGNEICRLFVLPGYQGQGYGTMLMDALEERIFGQFEAVHVDASFPAEVMYIKRGYRFCSYDKIETDNGDFLCYHTMEKTRKSLWKCVRLTG